MSARTTLGSRQRLAVLAGLVLLVVVVVGVVLATRGSGGSPSSTPSGGSTPSTTGSATPIPHSTGTPKVVQSTGPAAPQATTTVAIGRRAPVVISHRLGARVVAMRAVTGVAQGPGEIGGPSVRFSVRIINRTGKPVSLATTVVNAFYGSGSTPAVPLRMPGGRPFPASVKDGTSALGVFVFNIPTSARADVRLTVDTAVGNTVADFRGAAPQ